MGLCGCNLKEELDCLNGIDEGKNWHQIRHSRSDERQKICRIVAMKISEEIFFAQENLAACVVDRTHTIKILDMIDEMKHLPGAWIWKNIINFTNVLFVIRRRREVCCLCLVTAVENVSIQFVFWSLGSLSKTCLLQKWLPLRNGYFPRTLWLLLSVQWWLSKLREDNIFSFL